MTMINLGGSNMANNLIELITLLDSKVKLKKKLADLIYGSIEVRETDSNKYIYVHYREDGIRHTKYVDEFSDELYNLIVKNNQEAKQVKKEIREIKKKLKALNYKESELSEEVQINIDFARRHLADTIYKQAILEGVATTYMDTETILEGGKVNNMTPDDVMKIINLKHAWEFILNSSVITSQTNYALLCEINKLVLKGFYYTAGKIRTVPVSIGGTTWRPKLPIESTVKEELKEILNSNLEIIDKAIELLLYTMKKQIFIDGNKRTAVIFANHILISHGQGLITIPVDKTQEYRTLLLNYYENTDTISIKQFLKEVCYNRI